MLNVKFWYLCCKYSTLKFSNIANSGIFSNCSLIFFKVKKRIISVENLALSRRERALFPRPGFKNYISPMEFCGLTLLIGGPRNPGLWRISKAATFGGGGRFLTAVMISRLGNDFKVTSCNDFKVILCAILHLIVANTRWFISSCYFF